MVNVQPGAADRIALLLVSSTHYGAGLTFTAFDGKNDGATVALAEPQVFSGGAVALLRVAPKFFKLSNALADAATVNIYVFRDATP